GAGGKDARPRRHSHDGGGGRGSRCHTPEGCHYSDPRGAHKLGSDSLKTGVEQAFGQPMSLFRTVRVWSETRWSPVAHAQTCARTSGLTAVSLNETDAADAAPIHSSEFSRRASSAASVLIIESIDCA